MTRKHIAITIFVEIIAFAAGFLLRPVWNASTADEVQTGSGTGQIYQSGNESPSQGQILSQETGSSTIEPVKAENTIPADNVQVRVDDGLIQWYDGTIWHTVATVEELSQEDKFNQALEAFQIFSQELQQEKAETPSQSQQTGTFWDKDGGLSVGKKETPKATPKPAATPPAAEEPTAQEPAVENTAPAAPSTPAPSAPSTPSVPDTPSTPAPSEGDGEDMEWTPDFE
ncbi:MAG: hypothetical protein NC432_00980 [Roseburia sp.]|nr:hypothetical protein [Roseburia sp.]MCM1098298.1 hypothetical protein [Ruminococcus flavefaciens]